MSAPKPWHDPTHWQENGLTARLLAPLSPLYSLVGKVRRGLTRPYRAPVPVICVGNPTAGGAGKTPIVQILVDRLTRQGHHPAIVLRGHGGYLKGPVRVDASQHDARAVGDEAMLHCRHAPTWVGRDRPAAMRGAIANGADIIVMDDGFQNPTVAKDISLLVIDGVSGIGNGRVHPAGPLREPFDAALKRADAVIMMGADETDIAKRLPDGLPLLRADLQTILPDGFDPKTPVIAFAGIGRPEKFFTALRTAGVQPATCHPFPDHHPYRAQDWAKLCAEATQHGACLMTTEKDAVRLPKSPEAGAGPDLIVTPLRVTLQDDALLDRLLKNPLRRAVDDRRLSRSRRILYAVQNIALRGVLAVIRLVPFETASAIGGWVFRMVGPRLPADRVARGNLARAFPDFTKTDINRTVSQVWDNLGRGAAEYAHIAQMDTLEGDRVQVIGEEHLMAARDSGAPFIIFSAHLANWEIASLAAAQRGCLLANIYRPASNPGIDRLIRSVRQQFGAELLPKGREGARGALKVMRENRPLALLIDQKLNEGLAIPFFGRDAMTASAPAELALRFRCRVLPVQLERLAHARFRVTVEPPMSLPDSGDRARDLETLLRGMNERVEAWVRANPGQWFWVHRRWPKDS